MATNLFQNMSLDEQTYLDGQRLEMLALKQQIKEMMEAAGATGFGKGGKGSGRDGDERGRALLNRKDFSLVDKFDGNQSKFKSWLFDLLTALGSVDPTVARDIRDVLKLRAKIVVELGEWVIPQNLSLDCPIGQGPSNHTKFKAELYALIVGLTTGEAKTVVRGISEKGYDPDGFLALLMLQARYDANTAASLMQCVMEVVSPPTLKNHQGILKGISEWEVRVDGLKMKHNEDISPPIKIAVLVGMLPKEYQDIYFQQELGTSSEAATQEQYEELRDKIMSMAGQRVSMSTPVPMDIGALTHGPCPPSMVDEWGEFWNQGPQSMSTGYEKPHSYQYQNIYDIDSVRKGFQKGKGFG